MKKLGFISSLVLCMALTCPVSGQAPPPAAVAAPIKLTQAVNGPSDMTMVGPKIGDVKAPIVLTMTGLPDVDLTKPIGEATKWTQMLAFDVDAPDGAKFSFDKELAMSISPFAWKLHMTLVAEQPGIYVVLCRWNEPPYGLAKLRVTVGTVVPPAPVVTADLAALPLSLAGGETSTVSWTTTGAELVTLDNSNVLPAGSLQVKPATTTVYTLRAIAGTTAVTKTVQVTVTTPPEPPAPITEDGLRVLFVIESNDVAKLTPGQRAATESTAPGSLVEFMNANCVKDSKGNPSWRKIDPNNVPAQMDPIWAKALAKEHPGVNTPYMIVSNGKTGVLQTIPEAEADIKALVQKYKVN